MMYFEGMPTKQKLRKLKHYNKADRTYYCRDSSYEFDWAVPRKYYEACKRDGKRLPDGMPFPVPLARPDRLDRHGFEPGHRRTHGKTLTDIIKRQYAAHRWYEYEAIILWNKYRKVRGKLDRKPHSQKNKLTRREKAQVKCYELRANKWQVISKMQRMGQLDRDWRVCDFYTAKAISTSIRKNGQFPKNKKLNMPGSTTVLKYLRRQHNRKTKPDVMFRTALDKLFVAARAAGYDRKHGHRGGLPDHMPHEWLADIYNAYAKDTGKHHRENKRFTARELRRVGGDGCEFHCHKQRREHECKDRRLKKYSEDLM